MALQKLDMVPKELFVEIPGASSLVRPKVEYLGKEAREMPVLARQDSLEQLYTDNIIPVYTELKSGRNDGYSSLAAKQSLVKSGKVSKDAMVNILSNFGQEFLSDYVIWSELLDWQPEKRSPNYKMRKVANAVLYRNWDLSGGNIDISNAKQIPINWMKKSGDISKDIVETLNVPKDTYVWADRKYAIDNYDGLNALLWDFWLREGLDLDSYGGPQYGGSDRGSLLGRTVKAEEMVNVFDSSKFEAAKTVSKYQTELEKLENQLDELTKIKTSYDKKFESVVQQVQNLKKFKPE